MILSSDARTRAAVILGIIIATLAVYWQTLQHGFISVDDSTYIINNPHVLDGLRPSSIAWSFTTLFEGNWHPLTWLSHMVDVELFGLEPAGHHFMNILLHLSNTLLLLFLLNRMTGAFYRSALVAALFALHPLHVESVAWVAERKDLLSTFFGLAAVVAYCSYAARGGIGRYLLVAGLFAASLMSKPMLVTLPFLFLLLDFWPLSDSSTRLMPAGNTRRLLLEKVPFLAMSAVISALTYYAHVKAGGTATIIPLATRLANAVVSYVEYLADIFWPAGLAPFYPYPSQVPAVNSVGSCIVIAVVTWLIYVRRQREPYLLFGWLWFLGALVPVIGVVNFGIQSRADRYTYLSSVGIFMAVTWWLAGRVPYGRKSRQVLGGVVVALLALLGWRAWFQTGYWRDTTTLFEHSVKVTGGNYQANSILVSAARDREVNTLLDNAGRAASAGNAEEAAARYNEAISRFPDNPQVYTKIADTFRVRGNCDKAVELYRQALVIEPMYPSAVSGIQKCSQAAPGGR